MTLFVFFATAACLSANLGTAQDTGLPRNCSRNPFSLHLQQKKVGLFESPIWNGTSHCGQEWQRFGLCCNETELVEFAKADQASIERSVEAALESLNETLATFKSAMNKALRIEKDDFSKLSNRTQPLLWMLHGDFSLGFLNELQALLNPENFSSDLRRCWSKISSARSNSLCSVCSGRSTKFFSRGRIMMLEDDCSNILDECAASFRSLVDIVELVAKHSIRLQKYIAKTWHGVRIEHAYSKLFVREIKSQNIHTLTQRFISTTGEEKAAVAANLCSKFLNINGQSFIQKFEKVVQDLDFRKLKNVMSHSLKRLSNFESKGSQRLLSLSDTQSLPQPQIPADKPSLDLESPPTIARLFEGDVVIVAKNTDSSYTSYYGANGTTVSSHKGGHPFNITNIFP